MAVTHVQSGVVNHRINREPLDYESVMNSYEALLKRVTPGPNGGTQEGAFYAGLFTSVVNDSYTAYNGPYYISYNGRNSYVANRLASSYEVQEAIDEALDITFGWGHL